MACERLRNFMPIRIKAKVFGTGPGDQCPILGRVIRKTQEIVLVGSLLNTQHYKIRIKSKWRIHAVSNPLVSKILKREPSGHPRLRLTNLFISI